jgi:hypothetical protein
VLAETADFDKKEMVLEQFQQATVLDSFTDDEAIKRLRPLQSLHEKRSEELDKLVSDKIARRNYFGVGKAKDIIKKEKHDQYARTIAAELKGQIRTAHEKMELQLSRKDAQYVVDTLGSLKNADKEIGPSLGDAGLILRDDIKSLESGLERKLQSYVLIAGSRIQQR